MRIAVTAALAVALAGAPQRARAAEPEPQRLSARCEASAVRVVPCPQGRDAAACLLVGDNEESGRLFLYALDANDRLGDETPVDLVAADAAEQAPKLDDIEAIEIDGERLWVVASHGRKRWRDEEAAGSEKQCAVDGGRLAIFTGTWSPATPTATLAGAVAKTEKQEWQALLREQCADGLFELAAADAKGRALAAAACQRFAATDESASRQRDACADAFNVEGAAAIPGDDGTPRLWLGLRGPTLGGQALLLRWKGGDALRFDGIAAVDLGEARGIRDMAYAGKRLWLLGGPTADSTGVEFALAAAPFESLESGAQLTPKLVRKVREQAEGLAILPDGRRAGIVTDGEQGATAGAACVTPSTYFSVPTE